MSDSIADILATVPLLSGLDKKQRERFTRETQLLVEKAKADLRRETVDLTLLATAKLIGRSMSDADHRRLAEQALSDAETVARN